MAKPTTKPQPPASSGGSFLPADVADLYEAAPGIVAIFASVEFGRVDLRTISLEFAGRLAEAGYLIKKAD